jgi:hypothetical protein
MSDHEQEATKNYTVEEGFQDLLSNLQCVFNGEQDDFFPRWVSTKPEPILIGFKEKPFKAVVLDTSTQFTVRVQLECGCKPWLDIKMLRKAYNKAAAENDEFVQDMMASQSEGEELAKAAEFLGRFCERMCGCGVWGCHTCVCCAVCPKTCLKNKKRKRQPETAKKAKKAKVS